ncbi:MAG TPA: ABC transporter ATP-binding protein [Acidimicrobiia bacterium]|nr:ABC transporter ATP-binding protein [Acidimicrobiia bacterium]
MSLVSESTDAIVPLTELPQTEPPDETEAVEATGTEPELAIATQRLTKEFEEGVGVFDLDLEVPQGTIFGFIGPSGSGKTTTIRLMTGVVRPDSGQLAVLGRRPVEFDRRARADLGYMPQLSVLYPELSIRQNLSFAASLFGMGWHARRQSIKETLGFVELWDDRHRLLREASGGMQRRLALAATLIHKPELLFLDEPTAGIDPVLRRKFWDHFLELKEQGRTLFITTQYVGEAAYCDKVGVLAEGRLLTVDTPDGLRRQAMGGEVLDLKFASSLDPVQIEELVKVASASDWDQRRYGEYRLVVEDAGEVSPAIGTWAKEKGLELETAEPYLPPFDDVFVELVGRLSDDEPNDG